MTSSTKREFSHDRRDIEPRQRRSSRLNKKFLKSIKVMKIVRIVTTKVNHHPKCPFGVHQIYPRELKSYSMQ
jgi:pterin-4a-carbinolamine dehydratase